MVNILHALQHLNLDESKIKSYLATLELGTAKAPQIATKAGLKRTAVYENLEKLRKIGLITSTQKGSISYYSAVDPKKIEQIIEQRADEIKQAIPILSSLFKSSETFRPTMRFYEGTEGVKSIIEEILSNNEEKFYRVFQSPRIIYDILKQDNDYADNWTKRRIQQGIGHLSLRDYVSFKERHYYNELAIGEGEEYLRTIKYLPKGFDTQTIIYIWDHKVAVLSRSRENYSFIIESNDFSKTMKQVFDLVWSISKTTREMELE